MKAEELRKELIINTFKRWLIAPPSSFPYVLWGVSAAEEFTKDMLIKNSNDLKISDLKIKYRKSKIMFAGYSYIFSSEKYDIFFESLPEEMEQ